MDKDATTSNEFLLGEKSAADLFKRKLITLLQTYNGVEEFNRLRPSSVDLSGVNLSGKTLSGVDFSEANLSRANLSGAQLNVANLSGANLSGAKLNGADLSEANLCGANLSRADLVKADFYGVNFWNTYKVSKENRRLIIDCLENSWDESCEP